MTSPPRQRRSFLRTDRLPALLLAALLAVHLWRVLALFPSLAFLADGDPLLNGRFPLHLAAAVTSAQRLAESGHAAGYDPFVLAGTPSPVRVDHWDRVLTLLSWAAGAVHGPDSLERAALIQKWLLVATLLAAPLLALHGARNLGLSSAAGSLVTALSLLWLWFLGPPRYLGLGLLPVVLATVLALHAYTLWERFLQRGGKDPAALALLCVEAALLVMAHPLGPCLVAVPAAVRWALGFRSSGPSSMTWPRHALLLAVPAAALAANLWWWPAALDLAQFAAGHRMLLAGSGPDPLTLLLALLAVPGLLAWRTHGRRETAWALAAGALTLLALAWGAPGTAVLADWEPGRASVALAPWLALLAVPGLLKLTAWTFHAAQETAYETAWATAGGAVVLVLGLCPIPGPAKPYTGLTPEARELARLVREETGPEGRVLVEAGATPSIPGEISALLPVLTGVPLVTGPCMDPAVSYGFTACDPVRPFGLEPMAWKASDLPPLLETYNVRWVLAHTGRDRRLAAGLAARLSKDAEAGGRFTDTGLTAGEYRLFRVKYEQGREPGWFLKGTGRAAFYWDAIELSELAPRDGEVILRLHHLPGLVAEPPCAIESTPVPGGVDPVGFIRLVNPPPRMVIYY